MTTLEIQSLRPTQFTVGMREVEERAAKLDDLGRRDLRRYLEERAVPVVVGPDDEHFMVDRHHLSLAAARTGVRTLPFTVVADWSQLTPAVFWSRMKRTGWVYLYERGEGPHDPDLLPSEVRQLTDDPYRSLAWKVRKRGGYRKVEMPFTDFRWADYFRERVELGASDIGFAGALDAAWFHARSPDAAHLPGYIGFGRCKGTLSALA